MREKPQVKEKNNLLCQKLVQKGRVLSDYYINRWKPIHHRVYIYMGEKIHNFSSPHMSHHELFRSKQKREIKSPNSKKERISYHIMLLNNWETLLERKGGTPIAMQTRSNNSKNSQILH